MATTKRRKPGPKSKSTAAPETPSKLARSERWAGLQRGDPVEITGTRMISASWKFMAHVRNTGSGEEWIEVVGGRSGDRKVRSFTPAQVFPPKQKGRQASPSLADAPQLPLG